MKEPLADYLRLASEVYDAFGRALLSVNPAQTKLRPAGNVQLLVFARVLGDLRACQRAAADGYAMQALTLAATIHEVSYAATYLEDSDDRAREWIEHANVKKQYPECGHEQVIRAVGKRFDLPEEKIQQEYEIYRQLCLAKHGNSVLQRQYGSFAQGELRVVLQIPYFSERTVRFARFALLHACRAVAIALDRFAILHLEEDAARTLIPELADLANETQRLAERDRR